MEHSVKFEIYPGSRSPDNFEFGHFTLLFCGNGKEMYKNSNARAQPIFSDVSVVVFYNSLLCVHDLTQEAGIQ